MIKAPGFKPGIAWFSESGPDNDVVISSRARLSRNLNGFLFPGLMDFSEQSRCQREILSIFSHIYQADKFVPNQIKEMTPLERRLLMERSIIPHEYSIEGDKALILHKNRSLAVLINETDHIRLSHVQGGFKLEQVFKEVDNLDNQLEEKLDYAVNLEIGYLNREIDNVGTGLRTSVVLHLPALYQSGVLDDTLKKVIQNGFGVKGYFGGIDDDEKSSGNFYQISNEAAFGISEEDILHNLHSVTEYIAKLERKAREELLSSERLILEDLVMRAWGTVRYAKVLSEVEAKQILAALRFGTALGIITIPYEVITTLMVVSQKAHIQYMLGGCDDTGDPGYIDYTRASFIRDALHEYSVGGST